MEVVTNNDEVEIDGQIFYEPDLLPERERERERERTKTTCTADSLTFDDDMPVYEIAVADIEVDMVICSTVFAFTLMIAR